MTTTVQIMQTIGVWHTTSDDPRPIDLKSHDEKVLIRNIFSRTNADAVETLDGAGRVIRTSHREPTMTESWLPDEEIAGITHAANIAYSKAIGDGFDHKPWDETPEHIRAATLNGVRTRLENPGMTTEEMHNNWLAAKREAGYTYGPVKDDVAKTHPCMVDYKDLPAEQQIKDRLFSAIVDALAGDR